MIGRVMRELANWVESAISWMPGALGYVARRKWFGRTLGMLGEHAILGQGLALHGPSRIRIGSGFSCWRFCTLAACSDGWLIIGNGVGINSNVYINACNASTITIGDNVRIGPNVVLRASDHVTKSRDLLIRQQGHTVGRIVIEDDVWLGANVTVVAGVAIKRGAVVGANAVVTRDVEPYTIVGGVPARPIGMRGAAPSDGT